MINYLKNILLFLMFPIWILILFLPTINKYFPISFYVFLLSFMLPIYFIIVIYFDHIKKVSKVYKPFMKKIIEEDDLYKILTITRPNYNIRKYQGWRVTFSIIALLIIILSRILSTGYLSIFSFYFSIMLSFAIFKAIYYFEKGKLYNERKKLNTIFPYYIQQLVYILQDKAVSNALESSIEIAPNILKEDISLLVTGIHNNPMSIDPYNIFINKYNSVEDISKTFRIIYRLSYSNSNEHKDILNTLTRVAAKKVSNARKQKNDKINIRITYTSMIPPLLLGILYIFLISFMMESLNKL